MSAPSFTPLALIDGNTAHANDVVSQFDDIAEFLGNDTVTTDTIIDSGGANILVSDLANLTINVANRGGNKAFNLTIGGVIVLKIDSNGFHVSIGGTHVFTVDASGNAVFKGTVTPSGSPT